MHDDRTLVEDRLERALHQFIRPAQYSARTPLALSVRHIPGEPIPVAQVLRESFEPFRTGTEWGKPWSTSWFRLEGTVPSTWAGRRVEVVVDPGFSGQAPGFQAEGMLYDTGGVPIKGIHPRNRHLTVAAPAAGASRSRCCWRRRPTPPCWNTASRRHRSGTCGRRVTGRSTGSPPRTWRCWTRRSGIWSWTSRYSRN